MGQFTDLVNSPQFQQGTPQVTPPANALYPDLYGVKASSFMNPKEPIVASPEDYGVETPLTNNFNSNNPGTPKKDPQQYRPSEIATAISMGSDLAAGAFGYLSSLQQAKTYNEKADDLTNNIENSKLRGQQIALQLDQNINKQMANQLFVNAYSNKGGATATANMQAAQKQYSLNQDFNSRATQIRNLGLQTQQQELHASSRDARAAGGMKLAMGGLNAINTGWGLGSMPTPFINNSTNTAPKV